MNNKIGYKTESYKRENYQMATMQEDNTFADSTISRKEVLMQLGYEKASTLLLSFLTDPDSRVAYSDVLAKELTEIRKHFFEMH
ncbi:hypothetical protein [Amniculibacterium sp. G2-70]|uniref:hypothetical protein n=1 Tax=Amniculibacterium sp. G2-70 TaxID=2767188 RepID=UPI001653FD6D|nr:hypothetical protein [Amniculibacterium sp. G2-70]